MQQQLMLQQLAQRGFKPHQLQQMLQSNTLQNFLGVLLLVPFLHSWAIAVDFESGGQSPENSIEES